MVRPGWSNSVVSRCTFQNSVYICKAFLKLIPQNQFIHKYRTKHRYTNIKHKFSRFEVLVASILPLLNKRRRKKGRKKVMTWWYRRPFCLIHWYKMTAFFRIFFFKGMHRNSKKIQKTLYVCVHLLHSYTWTLFFFFFYNIFHLDVHYVCMLVQRFEPQGRRFTNFHYYYYNIHLCIMANTTSCTYHMPTIS